MLQSFVLIRSHTNSPTPHVRSPLLSDVPDEVVDSEPGADLDEAGLPESKLRNMGFRVFVTDSPDVLRTALPQVDAALLSVVPSELPDWRQRIVSQRSVPILWWCDVSTFPGYECKLDLGLDGILGPGMSAHEIHGALLLCVNQYFQRTAWQQEREQLLAKLEERKWIDQAKRILSEIKGISEAEAYEVLRKQAMNDRKRLADVATSIVKVYQLLQEENKGGRRR